MVEVYQGAGLENLEVEPLGGDARLAGELALEPLEEAGVVQLQRVDVDVDGEDQPPGGPRGDLGQRLVDDPVADGDGEGVPVEVGQERRGGAAGRARDAPSG